MKTRKQKLIEMIESTHDDILRLEIARDFRITQPENAENTKEINAANFQIERSKAMIEWSQKELLTCE